MKTFFLLSCTFFSFTFAFGQMTIQQVKEKAEQGDKNSIIQYANALFQGRYGLTQDTKSAFLWYEKASNMGDNGLENILGEAYLMGSRDKQVKQDLNKAEIYFSRLSDPIEVAFNVMRVDAARQDHTKAVKKLKELADKGHPDAMFMMGHTQDKNGEDISNNFALIAKRPYSFNRQSKVGSVYKYDDGKMSYALIDLDGRLKGPYKYADLNVKNDNVIIAATTNGDESEGFYGLLDLNGKELGSFKYSKIEKFYDGTARMAIFDARSLNESFGIIDEKGREIIKPKYKSLYPYFTNGFLIATYHDLQGKNYVSKTGGEFFPSSGRSNLPENLGEFSEDGLAWVDLGDRNYALYERSGKHLFTRRLNFMPDPFKNGQCYIVEGEYGFKINKKGVQVSKKESYYDF